MRAENGAREVQVAKMEGYGVIRELEKIVREEPTADEFLGRERREELVDKCLGVRDKKAKRKHMVDDDSEMEIVQVKKVKKGDRLACLKKGRELFEERWGT